MPSWRLLFVCVGFMSSVIATAQEAPVAITTGNYRDVDPAMSPDGNMLVFASDRTGPFNIFLFDYRTKGFTHLTQGPKDDRHPHFSPDGKKIIFNSKRTGEGDLYEMGVSGQSGFLQLSDHENFEEYGSYASKNGGILFARSQKRKLLRREMNVMLASGPSNTRNARTLAEGDEPIFSPNGSKIAFVSRRTKNNDVWIMNADGSLQTQLTSDSKDDENPAWSPDGKYIAFASNRTGNYDIWVMEADGSNQRQLTSSPEHETQPCWSSGGYIYYTRRIGDMNSNIWRLKAPK